MSQWDLNVTVTGVPAGTFSSSGRITSRVCPPSGGQPKSLPDPDHQMWSGDAPSITFCGSMTSLRGSRAAYASPLFTLGPLRVYFVPSGRYHSISFVFSFESRQLLTVVDPGPSSRGTSQPSSCFENTSMCCDLSVAIRFQSP